MTQASRLARLEKERRAANGSRLIVCSVRVWRPDEDQAEALAASGVEPKEDDTVVRLLRDFDRERRDPAFVPRVISISRRPGGDAVLGSNEQRAAAIAAGLRADT